MLLLWKIRYFDRADKQFKDRNLFLVTATLTPVQRAAVELLAESRSRGNSRQLLKFRSLFAEGSWSDWGEDRLKAIDKIESFCLYDYFESESGDEIAMAEIGPILTGDATSVLIPSGAKQHDIDYMCAEKPPVPLAQITLSPDETRLFAYFVRDFEELLASALMRDGSGTISKGGTLPILPNGDYHFQTAVTDDEIRSFITIFRRLYMKKEPANFVKAAALFEKTLGTHPLGKWVKGASNEYETHLQSVPELAPFIQGTMVTFHTKQLIDVFLYTQYAHQPSPERQRQFNEYLQQVDGKRNILTWLFLNEVWKCGVEIRNAGRVVTRWFKRYCDHHGITPDLLNSLRAEHTGLGTAEKEEARKARLFREKVVDLERELWEQAGKPEGGPTQFRLSAELQLKQELYGQCDSPGFSDTG